MGKVTQLLYHPGAKCRNAHRYTRHYSRNHVHFVSVFAGSGAEIMYKEPSPLETFNDIDSAIYNVFAVLKNRTQCDELIHLCENTLDGREEYEECFGIVSHPDSEPNPVRRAWAYITLGAIGFRCSQPGLNRSWATHDIPRKGGRVRSTTERLRRLPNAVAQWRERFRHVKVEDLDWHDLIDRYDDRDTLFSVDPPYHPDCVASGLYRNELSRADHARLLDVLDSVQGQVLLCGMPHPLYDVRLFHWRTDTYEGVTTIGTGQEKPKRLERIWMNYEADGSLGRFHKELITERFVRVVGGIEEAKHQLEKYERFVELGRELKRNNTEDDVDGKEH